jgi:hypothetical protein
VSYSQGYCFDDHKTEKRPTIAIKTAMSTDEVNDSTLVPEVVVVRDVKSLSPLVKQHTRWFKRPTNRSRKFNRFEFDINQKKHIQRTGRHLFATLTGNVTANTATTVVHHNNSCFQGCTSYKAPNSNTDTVYIASTNEVREELVRRGFTRTTLVAINGVANIPTLDLTAPDTPDNSDMSSLSSLPNDGIVPNLWTNEKKMNTVEAIIYATENRVVVVEDQADKTVKAIAYAPYYLWSKKAKQEAQIKNKYFPKLTKYLQIYWLIRTGDDYTNKDPKEIKESVTKLSEKAKQVADAKEFAANLDETPEHDWFDKASEVVRARLFGDVNP